MSRTVSIIAAVIMLLTAIAQVQADSPEALSTDTVEGRLPDLGIDHASSQGFELASHQPGIPPESVRDEYASRAGTAGSDAPRHPSHVFLPDDRRRQSPALPIFAQIVAGNDDEDGGYGCSATFIGPRLLLTAAHCLYISEIGGWSDYVAVVPGMDGESAPYETSYAASTYVPDGWRETEAPVYDFGLIVMADDRANNSAGSLPMGMLSTEALSAPDLNPVTVGYPGDKPFGTQWGTSVPAFDSVDADLLISKLDQYQGQSGSAVMRPSDNAIVGITSYEGTRDGANFNAARRINKQVIDFALSVCQQEGCTFDYFDETGQSQPPSQPPEAGNAFDSTWSRTDMPVASGAANRTWMWGPQPFTDVTTEPYAEAPDGQRQVIYYDKARMEITDPSADPGSVWYVTNGLLVVELITGRMQLGHDTFEQHQPAEVNVAGDADDPNGPTYRTFQSVLDAEPIPIGSAITQRIDRAGAVTNDPSLTGRRIAAAHLDEVTNHAIAAPFWTFMNATGTVWQNGSYVEAQLFENPYFATGRPVTEAYWARVQVAGTSKDVLMQCFERRCLTYTPDNPPGWQVEAGNVGQHYYSWRYEQVGSPPADAAPVEGDVLYQSSMEDWWTGTEDGTRASVANGTYHLQVIDGNDNAAVGYREPPLIHDDASISVDLRMVSQTPDAFGCLVYRLNPETTEFYISCIAGNGESFVFFLPGGEAEPVPVLDPRMRAGTNPPTEWNTLKTITLGNRFWVYANGTLLGTATHDGPASGAVAVAMFGPASSEFEFTDMVVRAVQ